MKTYTRFDPTPRAGFTLGGLLAIGALVVTLIVSLLLVKIRSVEAHEEAIVQTWDGIQPNTRTQGTYFLFPGYSHELIPYHMGVQLYVMNDKDSADEIGEGRKADAYVVQSKDQQDMRISLRLQWQRKRGSALIGLHQASPTNVEENLIRPAIQNVVKNQATLRTALEAYSGEGLVKLQDDILRELQGHAELNQFVEVKGFVIEHIGLNKEYTDEIVARQVAVQQRLKNIEQTKAAEAAADKAKAEAQANYEKVLVEARRDKEKGILDAERNKQEEILRAEAAAQQVVLAAKAEAERNIAVSEAQKQAEINRAVGIEAVGKAEAEAKRLQLTAFSVPGSDLFARVEVARSLGQAFSGIKGFLPNNMNYNLIAGDYEKSISLLMGHGTAPQPTVATPAPVNASLFTTPTR